VSNSDRSYKKIAAGKNNLNPASNIVDELDK
jgi:hypothetical protein